MGGDEALRTRVENNFGKRKSLADGIQHHPKKTLLSHSPRNYKYKSFDQCVAGENWFVNALSEMGSCYAHQLIASIL